MKFTSVIFDWDGTLAKTLHLWLAGYRRELENLGYAFSDEEIAKDFFYEHDKAQIKYPKINFDTFLDLVHTYVNSHVDTLSTYHDAHEVLEKLQNNNVTLTLVSSSPRKLLKEGLLQTGLAPYFQVIVAGDDVMRHKPDPEPFEQVIEIAGLDRKTTIILGDSHNDIIAAKAAGLQSCLFLPDENKLFYDFQKLKLLDPTYHLSSLGEFAHLILE